MTPTEAAALLTICAAYDNRKPDADAAKAWAMALDSHRFEDCRDAIVSHYRTSREWIMPADVIAAVKRVRGGRIEDVAPSPPADMDPDDTGRYARWLEVTRRQIADGEEPDPEPYRPTRQIGELRQVLRSVPALEAKPREKSAEHAERMAEVRAELAARPDVPVADALDLPQPPTPPDPAVVETEQQVTEEAAHG
jgi:hypothetical protein